jgi:tRNA A37 N6-isopentenylltransferase MiaA
MKWPVPPSVVCFVTNQHVSDRSKKKMVDELRAAHGVEVQIFDRSWIVAKVLENDGAELVYAHLMWSDGQTAAVAGPNDAQRRVRLDELVLRTPWSHSAQLVHDGGRVQAAVLSRELERPRAETAALFAQAIAV